MSSTKEKSVDMVPFRDPADMSQLVLKATENLNDLNKMISYVTTNRNIPIVVEKDTIDEVVNILKELDAERLWLHEAVEEETVRSSVFRHKLSVFPRDIEAEIRDVVRSARQSNNATVSNYKKLLVTTQQNIIDLKRQYKVLTVSNVTLGPEKSNMKEQYESQVEALNETLLKKASMQIKLNETRKELNDTILKTKDYRAAIEEIKEDMDLEQKEFEKEEKRLRFKINETNEKIEEQKEKNLAKKRELEEIQRKYNELVNEREKMEETIRNHEENNEQLQELCQQYEVELEKALEQSMKLEKTGAETVQLQNDLKSVYDEEKRKFNKKLDVLAKEVQSAQKEYDKINAQRRKFKYEFEAASLTGKKDKNESEDIQKRLRVLKNDLLHQTSECTRLKKENVELENSIDETMQNHVITSNSLNQEIETYNNALAEDRKERKLLQAKRDQHNKDMVDYFTEFNKFLSLTTKSIKDGKADHKQLNIKGENIQFKFKEIEQLIKEKQLKLQQDKSRYVETQTKLKDKETELLDSIKELKDDVDLKTAAYEKELPDFLKLEEIYFRKGNEFDKMKKLVVEVKSTKANLEATVEDKQSKLEKMGAPKIELENEVDAARKEYLRQLKNETDVIKVLEKEIHNCTNQYKAVQLQNKRFKKAIDFFQSDMLFMGSRMKQMSDGKQHIDLTIGEYKDWLERQWMKHMELDKMYHEKDIRLLDDIKKVEVVTSAREKKVEQIHYLLEDQLNLLTSFFDKATEARKL